MQRVSDYDFNLPQEAIAIQPAEPRDSARMLVHAEQTELNKTFKDLPDYLNAGDVLVLNNTKVIPARLYGGRKRTEAEGLVNTELLLHKSVNKKRTCWESFIKPAKRYKVGHVLHFEGSSVTAEVIEKNEDKVTLQFSVTTDADMFLFLEKQGQMPLPPYISRPDGSTEADKEDYQTVYAAHKGSVAAPTAGLHFTEELLEKLTQKGVRIEYVTLHVGAGTFMPVRAEKLEEHVMHAEWGEVTQENVDVLNAAKAAGKRIIPVGTTSLRLLETAAKSGEIKPFVGETDIFITPGFAFNAADMLITNFHLPKSTLIMLVSAFIGYDETMRMYQTAIENNFKFYSYGDGCLLKLKKQ